MDNCVLPFGLIITLHVFYPSGMNLGINYKAEDRIKTFSSSIVTRRKKSR